MRRALEDQKIGHHLPPDVDYIKMITLFDEMDRKK